GGDSSGSRRRGLTLVELLVVMAIIGALVALLLPAVQASREAARDATCKNHLRQLGLASAQHVGAVGHFPTGGWGASWTGDPRRGFGREQPGGWVYNLLDFLEEAALRRAHVADDAEQRIAAAQGIQRPLAVFICPSRRAVQLFVHADPYVLVNSDVPPLVARADYAINAGTTGTNQLGTGHQQGPGSVDQAASGYPWPAINIYNGVCHFRSRVRESQITDGTSHTYLAGEKSLDTRHYETGLTFADRGFALIGYSPDTVRMTTVDVPPRVDEARSNWTGFGSAHAAGCNFVFCDGSVRRIAYGIDPAIHAATGNRHDGEPAS
ncbi:MAG TPA: DUF1559 domain-containing protein, partial [Lacipirellulaceae bacterium]|nr:DUF1559 domain-containing protein [Lacipirellulaceae bacterium]